MSAYIEVIPRDQLTPPTIEERELLHQSWRFVADGVAGAETVLARFAEPWATAIHYGDDLRKLERRLADELHGVDWRWPWFEQWARTFLAWRAWPHMWSKIEKALADEDEDADVRDVIDDQVGRLIIHTAAKVFYMRRNVLKGACVDWPWRLVFIDDPGGVAERRAGSPYRDAVTRGDLSVLPPFFPGDRTGLSRVSPYRAAPDET